MPNPFRFFGVREFPDLAARPYLVPNQTRIGNHDARDTVLELRESIESDHGTLQRLDITHDLLVQQPGRAVVGLEDGEFAVRQFDEYITTHHLSGYLTGDRKLLVIEGTGTVVGDCYRTLRAHGDQVCIAQGEIDFEQLSPHLGRIHGAWFARTAGHVTSLGMFGPDVAHSAEWEDASLTSAITNLMVHHHFLGEWRTVSVTRDAGLVVYHNLEPMQMLGLVFDAYEQLLVPGLLPWDFSGNHGTARDTGLAA